MYCEWMLTNITACVPSKNNKNEWVETCETKHKIPDKIPNQLLVTPTNTCRQMHCGGCHGHQRLGPQFGIVFERNVVGTEQRLNRRPHLAPMRARQTHQTVEGRLQNEMIPTWVNSWHYERKRTIEKHIPKHLMETLQHFWLCYFLFRQTHRADGSLKT